MASHTIGRLLPLGALAVLAACALVVPLDDLGPPGGDGGSDSQGFDAVDAPADAAADVADGDAGTVHESGLGCDAISPTPTFCEDFDEPDAKSPPDIGAPNTAGSGTVAIDGNDFFSWPRSYLSNVPFSSASNSAANVVMTVASTPPSSAEVQLELLVDTTGTTASGFAFYQPNATNLTLVVGVGSVQLQEGPFTSGTTYNNHVPHTVDWTAGWVKLDLKIVQQPPSETLSVNGVVLESQALDSRFTFSGPMTFALGFTYVPQSSAAISARADNVAIWSTP
jgi:hypothetical protein